MTLRDISLGLILFSFTLLTYAGENTQSQSSEYFISLSAGPGWTNAGKSQTIALEPDVINTYVPKNLTNSHLMADGELFFGLQKSYFPCVQSQFGLALYASTPAILDGYIQVDGDPNFQNFKYQYKITHAHVALKTKWIAENSFNMNPYLSASIGVGLNQSYDYSSNPIISQELPPPSFKSHLKAAFSYTIGVGFQHTINCHYTIALGYELGSWGASSLNPASGQTAGDGLHLNNLYTQGVAFNLSYFL